MFIQKQYLAQVSLQVLSKC